jgi:hypothetical protein
MAQPKDVIDLLAAQGDDTLDGMAETLQSTIAQAQAQLELVEAARNRRGRRRPTSRRDAPQDGSGSRAHYLKRDELFQIVAEQGKPVSPAEIHAILVERGYDSSASAVRTGMGRLVERDGRLVRLEEGRYAVNYEREIGANANGNGQEQRLSAAPGQDRESASGG